MQSCQKCVLQGMFCDSFHASAGMIARFMYNLFNSESDPPLNSENVVMHFTFLLKWALFCIVVKVSHSNGHLLLWTMKLYVFGLWHDFAELSASLFHHFDLRNGDPKDNDWIFKTENITLSNKVLVRRSLEWGCSESGLAFLITFSQFYVATVMCSPNTIKIRPWKCPFIRTAVISA